MVGAFPWDASRNITEPFDDALVDVAFLAGGLCEALDTLRERLQSGRNCVLGQGRFGGTLGQGQSAGLENRLDGGGSEGGNLWERSWRDKGS